MLALNANSKGEKQYTLFVETNGKPDEDDEIFADLLAKELSLPGPLGFTWYRRVLKYCRVRIEAHIEMVRRYDGDDSLSRTVVDKITPIWNLISMYAWDGNAGLLREIQKAALHVHMYAAEGYDQTDDGSDHKLFEAVLLLSQALRSWNAIAEFKKRHLNTIKLVITLVPGTDEKAGPNLHCEMALVNHRLTHCQGSEHVLFDFMGCSKLCCVLCWAVLEMGPGFNADGCHYKIYRHWSLQKETRDRLGRDGKLSEIEGVLEACSEKIGRYVTEWALL